MYVFIIDKVNGGLHSILTASIRLETDNALHP